MQPIFSHTKVLWPLQVSLAFFWLQLLQAAISNNIRATAVWGEPVPSAAQAAPGAEPVQQRAELRQADPSTHPSLRIPSCSGCSHPASPCCRLLHCKVEKTSQFSFHTLKNIVAPPYQDLASIQDPAGETDVTNKTSKSPTHRHEKISNLSLFNWKM